jgi:hypothetical protein
MTPVKEIMSLGASVPENLAEHMTVARSCLAEIACIFLLRNVSFLKDLTIYEEAVIRNSD